MDRLRSFVVASAIMLSLVGVSYAADISRKSPPPRFDRLPALINVNNGWYVRGDLGWHAGLIDGAQSAPSFASPYHSELNNGMTASVGAGIKGSWLRTDVTVDYASALNYQGSISRDGDTTAKIQATTALFNGYLDLGTWYHMTPYIGAGAGVAYAHVYDYVSTRAPPFSGPLSGDTAKNQWNFAWAAMAGVGIPLSRNLTVDVGYRYLNIGDLSTASDAFGAMKFKNVAAHEVRFGLRWSFDDLRYAR